MSPLPGSPMGLLLRDTHFQSLFYITFRVPSKGAPPPPAPIERDAPFPEPSFSYLSEFPVNRYFHSTSLFVLV